MIGVMDYSPVKVEMIVSAAEAKIGIGIIALSSDKTRSYWLESETAVPVVELAVVRFTGWSKPMNQ